jgi:NTE family protein
MRGKVIRYYIINFFICLIILFPADALSQKLENKRPKIGLVLSGGAAKGIAHIGVLKVLEEAEIPVDYIAGTSMGAIIGGLYAIGYNASSLEKLTISQNWTKLLTDNVTRTDLSIEEKEEEDMFFVSFPLSTKGFKVPAGIIAGQNIENLLNKLCFQVYQVRDFSQLQIPFRCIAMDIISGKEVVLENGYLPTAMRASMAIPSLFAPVALDTLLLVDGGVINNFPADRLKEMGADIIIGVDVAFQELKQVETYDIFRIFEQTIIHTSEPRLRANLKMCNILIKPDLTGLGASDFNKADTLIARGERAARNIFPALKQMSDSLKNYYAFKYQQNVLPGIDSLYLKEIRITGLDKVSSRLLMGKIHLDLRTWIKPEDIEKAINNAFSSLYFSKVTYELQPVDDYRNPNSIRLLIYVTEKKGGLLRVGINYNTDFSSSIILNLAFRNLLFDGSKLSTSLKLGENPKIMASYFKNNGIKPGFGLEFEGENMDVYLYKNDRKIATIDFTNYALRFFTQSIFGNSVALGGGLEFEYSSLKPVVGEIMQEKDTKPFYNGYLFIDIDRYDDPCYPANHGSRAFSIYKLVNTPGTVPIHFFNFHYEQAIQLIKRIVLKPSVFSGYSTADTVASIYQLYMGGMSQMRSKGLIPFTGLDFMQINSRVIAGVGLNLQFNIWRNNFVVLRANAASTAWTYNEMFQDKNNLLGFGITLGNNSIIGPIEVTFMLSNAHKNLLTHFNIGYWF